MPALQVKDCPESVYDELRICARDENRSISQQALTIIEEYLGFRNSTSNIEQTPQTKFPVQNKKEDSINYVEKRLRIFEDLAKLPPLNNTKNMPSMAELVRQSRDEDAR